MLRSQPENTKIYFMPASFQVEARLRDLLRCRLRLFTLEKNLIYFTLGVRSALSNRQASAERARLKA